MTIRVLGLFNAKIRRGIRGRARLFAILETQLAHKLGSGKRVWFHASSMGEFEQAKPIIAELKQRYESVRIIVTFFSPSGFEHSKKYHLADVVSYLPLDTRSNAARFLDLVDPDVAVFIRYDIWPNHIWELQRRGVPLFLANATMRLTTKRRLPLARSFHHLVYDAFTAILTVSPRDVEAFRVFQLTQPKIEAIGDSRYDQVSIRKNEAAKRRVIAENILRGKKVIVAGSSWPEDEEVLIPAFVQLQKSMDSLMLILVPHEPTIEHLEELESELEGKTSSIRFSALNDYAGERVIIVDSIGILLALYAHADLAYIGGSFKQNVHNVLEAAVYGVPVMFGPKHTNSQEAVALAGMGGAFVVEDAPSLYKTLRRLLERDEARLNAGRIASRFVEQNIGATARFLRHIESHIT